jgi:hypothetical protein
VPPPPAPEGEDEGREPPAKRSRGEAAPELSKIMGEEYKPSADPAADLDAGREQITAYKQGDFPSLDKVMNHFDGLDAGGARAVRNGLEELKEDPGLRGALHEVAEDDTAFDQALRELPLTGAKREIAERFLSSYRESVINR